MTEYSNVINCSWTYEIFLLYSCFRKQKSLELIAKVTVKRTIENIRKTYQTNAYIRALSKQKGPL